MPTLLKRKTQMIFEFTLFWGLFSSLIVIVLASVALWQLRDIKRRYDIAYDTASIRVLTTICWVLVAIGAFSFFLFLMFGFYAAMRRYFAQCDNAIFRQQIADNAAVVNGTANGSAVVNNNAAIAVPHPVLGASPAQSLACFARDLDVNGAHHFTRIPCPGQTLV